MEHVPTRLLWPGDLFALSHVAVPVPADDPVYGEVRPARRNGRIWLGHAALYGERDMLLVPETALLRLRYNPFFPWMTQRIRDFLEVSPSAHLEESRGALATADAHRDDDKPCAATLALDQRVAGQAGT